MLRLLLSYLTLFFCFNEGMSQDFWQKSDGPFSFGGYITYLICNDSSNIWVGTIDDGIYFTSDLGNSWQFKGFRGFYVNSVISIPTDYVFVAASENLFRSSNNGTDWEEITNNLPNHNFIQLAFVNTSKILIATSEGLFSSIDSGDKWIRIDSGFVNEKISKIRIGYDKRIYVLQDSSIYFSDDEGISWETFKNLPNGMVGDLTSDTVNNIYLTIKIPGASVTIGYRSSDNGITWQQFGPSCPTLFWTLEVAPNCDLYMQGTMGIYKSTDLGETWDLVNSFTGSTCFSFISDNHLISGSYSGIRRSTDGGRNWQLIGLPNSYPTINCLAADSSGHILAGTGGNLSEIFYSSDHGANWINISGKFVGTGITCISFDESGNILAGSFEDGIYYSNNFGKSWEQRNTGLTSLAFSRIIFDTDGYAYTATWDGKIFRTDNLENDWTACDVGENLITIDDITISGAGNIYIGTNDGVFVSYNHGLSWIHLNNGWPAFKQTLSVAVNSEGHIYADASGNGIYLSTDFGNNWNFIDSEIFSPIMDIFINSVDHIFVAGANGVFRSTNNGNDWSLFNSGLKEWNGVNAFAEDVDGRIIAATHNQGVCWTTSSTTYINNFITNEKKFILSPNYPNPFNTNTQIKYSIPTLLNPSNRETFVTMTVYDILGRKVAT